MKRVAVTGGTGFVGANLTRRLLRDGHRVHLLVRPGFRPWRIKEILRDVELHDVLLQDAVGMEHLIRSVRPEWVFHLAAHGAYSHQTDLRCMVETNLTGTMNLVGACLRADVECVVHTGSSSEYGFKKSAPDETAWLEPNSHYAVTKASATLFCRYTAQSRNIRIATLRLYSIFGPFEEPTRLLPTLLVQGLRGKLPPLVNPDTARDYVYVDDAVDACILAADRPGQEPGAVYNVGTGTQTTLRQVVQIARRELAIPEEPVWNSMPAKNWDTGTWIADSWRIRRELGWQPAYDLEGGFRRMLDWYRDSPELRPVYEGVAGGND